MAPSIFNQGPQKAVPNFTQPVKPDGRSTVGVSLGSAAIAGTGVSIAATPNAAAVGDFVIVSFAWAVASIALSTVTDTSGNTWTVVSTAAPASESGGYAYTKVTVGWSSGANTVTGTLASGTPGGRVWAAAGIPAVYNPVFDQQNASGTTSNNVSLKTTNNLAQTTEALFLVDLVRSSTANPVWYWGSNFTPLVSQFGSGTPASGTAIAEYDSYQDNFAYTGTFASDGTGDNHGTGIIAVKIGTVPLNRPTVIGPTMRSERLSPDRRTSIYQNRTITVPAAAPTVTPTSTVRVVQARPGPRQPRQPHTYSLRGATPVVGPTKPVIVPARPGPKAPRQSHIYSMRGIVVPVVVVTVTPTRPVVILAPSSKADRRTHIVTNRWSGYQWVGLPAITPLIQPKVVQAPQPKPSRHGSVTFIRVKSAPITPTRPYVVTSKTPKQSRRGSVISIRSQPQGVIMPTRPFVVRTRTPRQDRHGSVIQPRVIFVPIVNPVTPPRTVFVVGANTKRQFRNGSVTWGMNMAAYGSTPAPPVVITATPTSGGTKWVEIVGTVTPQRPPGLKTRRGW